MTPKPEPLPVPSTDHDLTNISSKDHLAIWDTYVCAAIQGAFAFHGTDSRGSDKAAARHAAATADALMELQALRTKLERSNALLASFVPLVSIIRTPS